MTATIKRVAVKAAEYRKANLFRPEFDVHLIHQIP